MFPHQVQAVLGPCDMGHAKLTTKFDKRLGSSTIAICVKSKLRKANMFPMAELDPPRRALEVRPPGIMARIGKTKAPYGHNMTQCEIDWKNVRRSETLRRLRHRPGTMHPAQTGRCSSFETSDSLVKAAKEENLIRTRARGGCWRSRNAGSKPPRKGPNTEEDAGAVVQQPSGNVRNFRQSAELAHARRHASTLHVLAKSSHRAVGSSGSCSLARSSWNLKSGSRAFLLGNSTLASVCKGSNNPISWVNRGELP